MLYLMYFKYIGEPQAGTALNLRLYSLVLLL